MVGSQEIIANGVSRVNKSKTCNSFWTDYGKEKHQKENNNLKQYREFKNNIAEQKTHTTTR